MVTLLGVLVATGKLALVAPAGILTLVGTMTAPAGSAARETAMPPPGAAAFRVTVPCSAWPSVTLAELRRREESSTAESWAETELTRLRQTNRERKMVPTTRIRLIDLVTLGPLASM